MNTPTAIIPFALLGLVLLTACPPTSDQTRDDTSEPADGGTGEAQCVDETAKIKALTAELAECKATAPK